MIDGAGSRVAFSPDGRRLGTPAGVIDFPDGTREFPSFPDESRILRGIQPRRPDDGRQRGSQTIRVLDARSGGEIRSFQAESPGIVGLAFSPDGRMLASASMISGEVTIWDVNRGQGARTITPDRGPGGPGRAAGDVMLSALPDGRTFIAVGADGRLRSWDAATGADRSPDRGAR